MLAPSQRRLLIDALAPEVGWHFDQAIGTTYTLDLLALLRVPLAATSLSSDDGDGRPLANPFALLSALRQHAEGISLFCHAGATKVPPPHQPLLAFLDGSVNQVLAPNGGLFHPKLWLLRFTDKLGPAVAYRLLVLSRNLTFDRTWDVALVLDGDLVDRRSAFSINRPLSAFLASLSSMAAGAGQPLGLPTQARVDTFADEVLRVRWNPPDGFELIRFWPIGHTPRPSWPFPTYFHRLLAISPFVGDGAVGKLGSLAATETLLISRAQELEKLSSSALSAYSGVFGFDHGTGLPDTDDESGASELRSDLAGLHAKAYIGEADKRANLWIGSANLTDAALGSERQPAANVEFLAELATGWSNGVQATHTSLLEAGLLQRFDAPAQPTEEDPKTFLARQVEQLGYAVAAGAFHGEVVPGTGRDYTFNLLRTALPLRLPEGVSLSARPVALNRTVSVDLTSNPAASFAPMQVTQLTSFVVFALEGKLGGELFDRHEFVARLAISGVPEGRDEAVVADLLSDRAKLMAFLLLLLATDSRAADAALDRLTGLDEQGVGAASAGGSEFPLLESMLRTLAADPDRLDEVGRLITSLSTAEQTQNLVSKELRELWSVIAEARGA